jgi:hypothetical protein
VISPAGKSPCPSGYRLISRCIKYNKNKYLR